MPSLEEIARAIQGAWILFRFDPRGIELFEDSPEAFWKSFAAALIVAPGQAVLVVLHLSERPVTDGLFEVVAVEAFSYVLLWTALPVVLYSICRILEREDRFIIAVIAINWSAVIQIAIALPPRVVVAVGLLPPGLENLASVIVFVLLIAYVWFVAKSALQISGISAAGIVLTDIALSTIIRLVTDALYI